MCPNNTSYSSSDDLADEDRGSCNYHTGGRPPYTDGQDEAPVKLL